MNKNYFYFILNFMVFLTYIAIYKQNIHKKIFGNKILKGSRKWNR